MIRVLVLVLLLTSGAACVHRYEDHRAVRYEWSASPCRVPDAATRAHLNHLRRLAIDSSHVGGGAEWHASTKVPVIADTANGVKLVLEPARCAAALAAYNTAVELADSAATEIELLQADTVFVASHPAIMSGEFVGRHVFDRRFRYLGSYLQ